MPPPYPPYPGPPGSMQVSDGQNMNVEPPGNVSAAALNGVSLAGLGTGPLFLTSGVPSMVNTPQQGQIALAAQAGPSQYSSTYDHLDGARWVSAGSATSAALLVVNSMDQ